MIPLLGLWLLQPVSRDTLRLAADSAFAQVVARAPSLGGSRARERAAAALVRVAGEPRNPTLTVVEENLGAQQQVTGRNGIAGLEGQATLSGVVPIGGDLSAAKAAARANRVAAGAVTAYSEAALREELAFAVAAYDRDAALASHSREEQSVLARFGRSMTDRAKDGRTSGGDAARARVEATLAASAVSRRFALADTSAATVARLLGTDGPIHVAAPACANAISASAEQPELTYALAREEAARQQVRLARARAIPDLQPQVGLRRTAGFSGLLLGVGIDLPLFNAGGSSIAAARSEADAAIADREVASERITSSRRGAEHALARLDSAAAAFGASWRDDLERSVRSAEARLESGEGTLTEYLDSRRARLLALDEYEVWRAERRRARAVVARYSGRTIDAAVLCDDVR